ncbi:hypothetical protein CF328_g9154 [Tilletia controversa]|nr:hypothetical protein CF328_g9154 [Tilletia controversa]
MIIEAAAFSIGFAYIIVDVLDFVLDLVLDFRAFVHGGCVIVSVSVTVVIALIVAFVEALLVLVVFMIVASVIIVFCLLGFVLIVVRVDILIVVLVGVSRAAVGVLVDRSVLAVLVVLLIFVRRRHVPTEEARRAEDGERMVRLV